MTAYEIIKKKRDGFMLTDSEIEWFISKYMSGAIPDYQVTALLMAIYINSMTDAETAALTKAMAFSGNTVDLSSFGTASVDKHSTGGVGDKTTLIVAPVVASLGLKVAKMSGRGLGFTGGTADKLASIPGYRTTLSESEFLSVAGNVGVAVITQSSELTPADKAIYALRDVTATVESLPLIASSIMSKKIATGAKNIVLDIKTGSGAFMKTLSDAEKLARIMVNIGKANGRNTAAVITDMNQPLGFNIGNNLEVIEAVNLLKGEKIPGLYEECVVLAAAMVALSRNILLESAKESVIDAIQSGAAYNKFIEWISAQGGDISYIDNTDKFPKAKYMMNVCAEKSGYIAAFDTETVGMCAAELGAGRQKATDSVDHTAGITLEKKLGEYVTVGEPLCTLYTNDKSCLERVKERYLSAVKLSDNKPETLPVIYKTITD